ncbi:ABC transporter substrate-binding protein [Bradyrhizobium vignae]|uniref:ABC transporter substrate-binding protein n=1 Tax=Bradyrhizobium vignae TaxID=1549949 RepID=UPI00100AA6CD|nr:ABC transporter substrate-binding protein [Bradyrhizobium vignae]RXH06655.1 ABC transporter substrate-binding protein [Bradyrhizobium vignae]
MEWIRNLVILASILGFLPPSVAAEPTKLRVVMSGDLKIIDPYWTSAYIVRNHAYMIYDTLFARDANLKIQPQMVDSWSVSEDQRTYTFKLREGLEWHDGQPVTSADVIPSIKRWAARDVALGPPLMRLVKEMALDDDRTFRIVLTEPTALLMTALAKPSLAVFVMPKRVADIDPNTQISDTTGSGPFIFKKDDWKPGEKAVYIRNPKYRPRAEAPSGLAGGKLAKVDRVEWVTIGDSQTAVNALINGEVDMIESPQPDLFPLLEHDPKIELVKLNKQGSQYLLRFNVLHKPFDNPKVRQAVLYALNQKDFLNAAVGDPRFYMECKAVFICNTPLGSTVGWDDKLSSNLTKAKTLLKEANYDGTPVVLMGTTDLPILNNLASVAKAQLEQVGFKVDLQRMDWSTLVARRAKKDSPPAGWNAMFTMPDASDLSNPLVNGMTNASCDKAWFGWPCDPQLEELRQEFSKTTDPEQQKTIAEAIQSRLTEYPTHVPLGQVNIPIARRKGVSGNLEAPVTVLWNVHRTQ